MTEEEWRAALTPEEAAVAAVARQFIEETDGHTYFEVFYRWLEFPEHEALHTRWFTAAEAIPAFRDGDIMEWEGTLIWLFSTERKCWEARRAQQTETHR